jgi:hypothetical protein
MAFGWLAGWLHVICWGEAQPGAQARLRVHQPQDQGPDRAGVLALHAHCYTVLCPTCCMRSSQHTARVTATALAACAAASTWHVCAATSLAACTAGTTRHMCAVTSLAACAAASTRHVCVVTALAACTAGTRRHVSLPQPWLHPQQPAHGTCHCHRPGCMLSSVRSHSSLPCMRCRWQSSLCAWRPASRY